MKKQICHLLSHGNILKWQFDCVGTHEICSFFPLNSPFSIFIYWDSRFLPFTYLSLLFTWVLDCRGSFWEMFSSNDQTDLASEWTRVCINLSLIDGNKQLNLYYCASAWFEYWQSIRLMVCVTLSFRELACSLARRKIVHFHMCKAELTLTKWRLIFISL